MAVKQTGRIARSSAVNIGRTSQRGSLTEWKVTMSDRRVSRVGRKMSRPNQPNAENMRGRVQRNGPRFTRK